MILSNIGPWSMNTFHYKLGWDEAWMKIMHIQSIHVFSCTLRNGGGLDNKLYHIDDPTPTFVG